MEEERKIDRKNRKRGERRGWSDREREEKPRLFRKGMKVGEKEGWYLGFIKCCEHSMFQIGKSAGGNQRGGTETETQRLSL